MSDHKDLSDREILLLLVQKVDTFAESNEKDHGVFNKRLDGYSDRIRKLENWRFYMTALVGPGSAIAGALGAIGAKILKHGQNG